MESGVLLYFFHLFDGDVGAGAEILLGAAAEGAGAVGAHAPRVAGVVVPLQNAPLAHLGGGQLQLQGGGADVRVGQHVPGVGGAGQSQRLEALLGLKLVCRVQPENNKNITKIKYLENEMLLWISSFVIFYKKSKIIKSQELFRLESVIKISTKGPANR